MCSEHRQRAQAGVVKKRHVHADRPEEARAYGEELLGALGKQRSRAVVVVAPEGKVTAHESAAEAEFFRYRWR